MSRRISSHGEVAQAELDPPPPSFFFTGCAWGCGFHVGAYRGMVERWGMERLAKCRFGGNSAGVLIAISAAQGLPWQLCEKVYLELADKAVEQGVVGKMTSYHEDALEQLVGPTTHEQVSGRLFVGVTYFPSRYEVTSSWASRNELLNTLHASMHIPFYCQHVEPVDGRMACDGGLASPYHMIDPRTASSPGTLVVDPFGASTLSLVKLEPLFPLRGDRYAEICRDGRKAILALVPPAPYPLVWPSAVVMLTWCGRVAEEMLPLLLRRHRRRLLLLLLLLALLTLLRGPRARAARKAVGARTAAAVVLGLGTRG